MISIYKQLILFVWQDLLNLYLNNFELKKKPIKGLKIFSDFRRALGDQ